MFDLLAAALGLCAGMGIGWHHVRTWNIGVDRERASLSLPGDVMMLVIILATFAFEFLLHAAAETHAIWFSAPAVPLVAAAIWAGFIGMSVGRNLHLFSRYINVPVEPVDQAG
ncbi:hypothetical protein QD461_13380 [Rhizobium sp. BR 314]